MTTTANAGYLLQNLTQRPADPLLGLMAAFRADLRADKIDLGVGVYRNELGQTPLMDAVARAEARLAATGGTKVYEGPRGNLGFCDRVCALVFGDQRSTALGEQLISFTTPGGCGALAVGFGVAARANPKARVWMSEPSWPNHPHVVRSAGLTPVTYSYYDAQSGVVDVDAMFADLEEARPGDVVLVQGPCHNPTGADLTEADWTRLARFCVDRGLTPFVDVAYHGLGESLERDIAGVRALLDEIPMAMVSYSCSKNFGLYRERAGALLIMADTPTAAAAISSHAADVARANYSMPPAHGAAIVAEILDDDDLRQDWEEELELMRARIDDLRTRFAAALHARTGDAAYDSIANQRGMFSMLALPPGAAETLKNDWAIYLPNSGRINIAGLSAPHIDLVAEAISTVMT